MRQAAKQILISSLVLLLFYGCRKEAGDLYPDMIGVWEYNMRVGTPDNTGILLTINEGKSEWCEYPQQNQDKNLNGSLYTGKAWIKDNQFNLQRIQVEINELPHYDADGNYVMKLGNRTFFAAMVPQNVQAVPQQADTVTFFWSNATEYAGFPEIRIEYKTVSETVWTEVNTNYDYQASHNALYFSPQRSLTGFLPATTYEWRMKTINGIHESGYTAVQTFTTQ